MWTFAKAWARKAFPSEPRATAAPQPTQLPSESDAAPPPITASAPALPEPEHDQTLAPLTAHPPTQPFPDISSVVAAIATENSALVLHSAHNSFWAVAQASQVGRMHVDQGGLYEDSAGFRLLPDGGLRLAVCDGVGSGARGDICAQALVQYALYNPLAGDISKHAAQQLMQGADQHVAQALATYSASPGASMLAAVWHNKPEQALLTHVGDCRIYRWEWRSTGVQLYMQTQDQSFGNLGQVPADSPRFHHPAYMVGIDSGTPEIRELSCQPSADMLAWGWLLCSDGIHGFLTDAHLQAGLQQCINHLFTDPGRSLPTTESLAPALSQAASMMLRQALVSGSDDDATVLIAATAIKATPNQQ